MEKIRVLVWNEYIHETESEEIRRVYPNGIHTAIAEGLLGFGGFEVKTATLDMPECGLDEQTLQSTDVLVWWSHVAHARVPDEIAERVRKRVLDGMGFVALHSSHLCKPFVGLMGTCCRSKWRENDEKERIWVIEPAHPIAQNLPEYIELAEEETYGERFEIPTPDELVFVSWFSAARSSAPAAAGSGDLEKYSTSAPATRRILPITGMISARFWPMPCIGQGPLTARPLRLET